MTFSSQRHVEPEYTVIPLDYFYPLSAKDRPVRDGGPLSPLDATTQKQYQRPRTTNHAVILKALARKPRSLRRLVEITGWHYDQVCTVIGRMRAQGLVQRIGFHHREAIYGRRG
jgi:predicted Rossmann fold nucleotide-binding protein DprA/Smf involved in DNA uptake